MIYHILLAVNGAYLQHAVVCINSVIRNNPNLIFHFHILYNELDIHELNRVKRWSETKSSSIFFYKINACKYTFPIKRGDEISCECYFRILAPNVLPYSIKRILYMDSDTVCVGSLTELFQLDMDHYEVACTEGNAPAYRKINLGIEKNQPYFQDGIMLMNLERWREYQITERILCFIEKNPDILLRWDQDALNAVLVGKIKKLDPMWNVYLNTVSEEAWKNMTPRIIHYTGSLLYKPWYKNSLSDYQHIYLKYRKDTPYEKIELENCQNVQNAFWQGMVTENDRVILYGVGELGKSFYLQNQKGKFCKIISWVDKKFRGLFMGVNVETPISIFNKSYEYILITIEEEMRAVQYASELIFAGVSENKILWRRSFSHRKVIPIETCKQLDNVLSEKIFVYGIDEVCASFIFYCKKKKILHQIEKIVTYQSMEYLRNIVKIKIDKLDNLDCINKRIVIASNNIGHINTIEDLYDRGFKEIFYLTYSCCQEMKEMNRGTIPR